MLRAFEYGWVAVVLILAVVGCLQAVRWIVMRVLTLSRKSGGVWVVPMAGHRSDAEYIVRGLAARRRWDRELAATEVAVADMGMDGETRKIVEVFCAESGIRLIRPEELPGLIESVE